MLAVRGLALGGGMACLPVPAERRAKAAATGAKIADSAYMMELRVLDSGLDGPRRLLALRMSHREWSPSMMRPWAACTSWFSYMLRRQRVVVGLPAVLPCGAGLVLRAVGCRLSGLLDEPGVHTPGRVLGRGRRACESLTGSAAPGGGDGVVALTLSVVPCFSSA